MTIAREQAHATATQYGTWVSYGGTAKIVLAIALLAAAAGVAYAGTRLPLPLRPARPGRPARRIMLAAWVFSILALLSCVSLIVEHVHRGHLAQAAPADPITPVTVIGVGVIFVILSLSSSYGWRVTFASAAIAALAAPMIFEFPFDLIVMARLYPPIPPDPALYRVAFFAPLFLVEFMTLALLTLSPMLRLSRATFFCVHSRVAPFATRRRWRCLNL